MFMASIFDKFWRPGLSVDEVMHIVDLGIAEVRARLVVAAPNFLIKIVDKDGVRVLAERNTITTT